MLAFAPLAAAPVSDDSGGPVEVGVSGAISTGRLGTAVAATSVTLYPSGDAVLGRLGSEFVWGRLDLPEPATWTPVVA